MKRIRKGDEVVVIAGKDKGRRGSVLRVLSSGKLVVEGVNVARKHQKPIPARGQPGGIVDREMPIQASNVQLWNAAASKPGRTGIKTLENGRKVRYFKSTGETVDLV
jgi:large subunit ribosomal protein L24